MPAGFIPGSAVFNIASLIICTDREVSKPAFQSGNWTVFAFEFSENLVPEQNRDEQK